MCSSPRTLTVELTGDSDYFASAFRMVVEHIHTIVLTKGHRHRYANTALEVLLTLVKKASLPLIDGVWINDLLKRAAWGKMGDETFTVLLRFSALREEDDATTDSEISSGQDFDHIQQDEKSPQSPGVTVTPENPTPEYALLELVLRNIKTCSTQGDGWEDDAVYGGLVAIKDIPGLRFCLPKFEFLETLSEAMEKGESKEGDKPFRVRKAAYEIVSAARTGWLKSEDLRQTLEDLDIPRKLYSVVIGTSSSDYQHSFLEMMEILSEDRFWDSYLKKAGDTWLSLDRKGPAHELRFLANVKKSIRLSLTLGLE